MKSKGTHTQGMVQSIEQTFTATEPVCILVRQARLSLRSARAFLRMAQPAVQHAYLRLRSQELSGYEVIQLSQEADRLGHLTQQLITLTHAFANLMQRFVLEAALQEEEQYQIAAT